MTSEALFVWVYLPGQATPVVAGRLVVERTAAGAVGRFVYGRSYLARPQAMALDPVALPLNNAAPPFTALGGFPGVVLDACPDRWGIKVIDRLAGKREFPAGYLLLNDPGRAGCLAFSLSASEPPQELASGEFPLAELLDAAAAVEADRPVAAELLCALHPGTGGARPKCNVVAADGVWIAKFPSILDAPVISIPRLEHATMHLARACGIAAAETRLEVVDGRDVCLVRRFDRAVIEGRIVRKGFISARSVFHADPAYAALGTGSYGRLARWLPRYGGSGADRQQLYRRMAFNCAVRNTDDHELNHGLVHGGGGDFALSPAYDIVPMLDGRAVQRHALLIGDSAAGTVANLASNHAAFGLGRDEALAIVAEIQCQVGDLWREVFYGAGFGDEELRRLEPVFRPLPRGDE
ncbi:MAG: HipA domain-containing protein [Sulfuritalea sp.]|nr:HipA domain-containing protein [Sulfuritalea sp.]